MKEIKWNVGILIVRIGYIIRGTKGIEKPYTLKESIGAFVLRVGYSIRGQVPKKTWRFNHV